MPRITEEEIERLIQNTDLGEVVRAKDVELERCGTTELLGKCPFHSDNESPHFIVSPAKRLYHCTACGATGNAIQFLQKYEGLSLRHAYEVLSDGLAAISAAPKGASWVGTTRRLHCPLDAGAEDTALMDQVVEYYHERLLKTPAALAYLESRGLCHDESIETFQLGFADRTLGLRIPAGNRKAGDSLRVRLTSLGLWRQSGHEHMSGCIVMPIRNEAGRITELYGRKITKGLRKGTPLHLYLSDIHCGVWNLDALIGSEVIVCNAPLDALTFWVNGLHNVTFIYSTQGFTDEILETLNRRRVRRVYLAYGGDESGNKAAERDALRLDAHGVECLRVKFPLGMDPNEYARKVQSAERSLRLAVEHAESMGKASPSRVPVPAASLAAELAIGEPAVVTTETIISAPVAPQSEAPPLEMRGDYTFLKLGPREYRIGGLEKNNSLEIMKVAVRLRHDEAFHLDSFDLLQDSQRRRFIERAYEETGLDKEMIKHDLGKLLLALERVQEHRLARIVEPTTPKRAELTPQERAAALAFLQSPNLVTEIGSAFETCGLVGEESNRLAAYLACTSRKLEHPLAVIVQSSSAAGKSTLMESVLAMFPDEDCVKYSAMTGQSLYYMGKISLRNKILAIAEEGGVEKASYALKLLQSEGELTIASTGKDPRTGRMETQEYRVEGPVAIFLTTTTVEVDEELLNRCLVLTVDESREQTERIHSLQRKARTLEGLRLKSRKAALLTLLRNAQRLLRPLNVINSYADALTFTAERTRTRRDHEKYLTLIECIALLHQFQRPVERDPESGEFIRVTLADIDLANRLLPDLLGRSLDDLSPQTRWVYDAARAIIRERCEAEKIERRFAFFSRRELRNRLGWSATQVRFHLERLQDLEYVATRTGRPGAAFQYELLNDFAKKGAASIGVLDVEQLRLQQTACRD